MLTHFFLKTKEVSNLCTQERVTYIFCMQIWGHLKVEVTSKRFLLSQALCAPSSFLQGGYFLFSMRFYDNNLCSSNADTSWLRSKMFRAKEVTDMVRYITFKKKNV